MELSFMVLIIRHREFAPRYATREMRLPCARAQVCTREENARMSDFPSLSRVIWTSQCKSVYIAHTHFQIRQIIFLHNFVALQYKLYI